MGGRINRMVDICRAVVVATTGEGTSDRLGLDPTEHHWDDPTDPDRGPCQQASQYPSQEMKREVS